LKRTPLNFPLQFPPLGDKGSLLTEKSVRHGETLKLKALGDFPTTF
jgi:hypothetical protein